MPLILISYIIQALLIVHCIKTGRNQLWIWVLAMLPFASIIAYVAAELVPDLLGSRATRRTVRGMKKALDPEADLRRLAQQAQVSGGIDARVRYAEELLKLGRADEAAAQFQQCLRGLYEHDANLMLGLARAQFAAGKPADARATLDALIKHNPQYRSAEGHLLYARALEAEGDTPRALEEYKVLSGYYPGAEAAVRYAQLLRGQGQRDEARGVLKGLLDQSVVAPAHYRRTQEEWLKQAERELGAL
ncbi:MAG: tetratricopeptide repeat protein [Steroidobacteraceae bacterium]